jgi:hypothetical protein
MIPELRMRLSVLGEDNPSVKACIAGARESHSRAAPIFNSLTQAHIEYGHILIHLLDFLQKNKAEWSYENGTNSFSRDSLTAEYNKLIEATLKQHKEINKLAAKLPETQ